MKNDSKVAVVTGAGRGIGRAISLQLATDGFAVAVSDIDEPSARRVADEVIAAGGHAIAVSTDVRDRASVAALIDSAIAELGPLAVMVNNAGVIQIGPILNVIKDDVDSLFAVNVHGVLFGMQIAAEAMIAAGRGGKIINACSIAGHEAPPLSSIYCASKFAVRALTIAAAREWGVYGITVNGFCPGLIDTEMNEVIEKTTEEITGEPAAQRRNKILERVALRRAGTVNDVAGMVSFMASPASDYMTGQAPIIDGGLVFR